MLLAYWEADLLKEVNFTFILTLTLKFGMAHYSSHSYLAS